MQLSLANISPTEAHWLEEALRQTFGDFDRRFLEAMKPELDWVRLKAGAVLFQQGDSETALYFLVAGRLRAIVRDDLGKEKSVGDIRRGQTVGEMALLTGERRSARVVAVRDSLLVRLSRESYEKVIRAYPLVSLHVARFIVERAKRAGDPRTARAGATNIAVMPASPGTAIDALVAELLPALARHGSVSCLDEEKFRARAGSGSPAPGASPDPAERERASRWIDEEEASSERILLVGSESGGVWNAHCLQHADEVIWIAAAGQTALTAAASAYTPAARRIEGARQTLLLLHPSGTTYPRNTRHWLDRLTVDAHLHLRRGHAGDLARVARALCGRSIGLVFGGGGARGFAHLGVIKALEEAGIPVDMFGGCSIGSVMAALAAFDRPADDLIALARHAFSSDPTGDVNLIPLMSLIKGQRLRAVIDDGVRAASGFDADVEDTWKPLYCIATNYSRATEAVLDRGPLARAVRASVSIPAALPPVIIDGDLMMDGGTFNNFPTDMMAARGAGTILGCDLMRNDIRRLDFDDMPSSTALALDRLRPRRKRRYRLPGLASIILNVSILHSQSRLAASRNLADVCFTPDVGRIGILDWKAFDKAVDAGYRHAQDVLAGLPEQTRRLLRQEQAA